MESRLSAYRALSVGPTLGIESCRDFGSAADWFPIDEQSHQVSPFAAWSLGEGLTLFTGALFSRTEATADQQFRVHLAWEPQGDRDVPLDHRRPRGV